MTKFYISAYISSFNIFFPLFLIIWHNLIGKSNIASNYTYNTHESFIKAIIVLTNSPSSYYFLSFFAYFTKSVNNY